MTLGIEYQAVVEYAPAQKTPFKAKVKVDARQGTIDEGVFTSAYSCNAVGLIAIDPDFQSFLQSLSAPITKASLEPSGTSENKRRRK
jgi:regulator of nonsense transcripts 3